MDRIPTRQQGQCGLNSGTWMSHIDDVYLGRWINPRTGKPSPRSVVDKIMIADSLQGGEADLVHGIGMRGSVAIVSDPETWDALGHRVAGSIAASGQAPVEVVLGSDPHATLAEAEALSRRLRGVDSVVAAGSGTINDLVKYVTARDGRPCCVFGTAPSMDGYTSSTVSMNLDSGIKVSIPSRSPKGVFLDLEVLSAAPKRMAAAGYGDTLCTSVARIDWWMSHRLTGSFYEEAPYLIMEPDARALAACAAGVGKRKQDAVGWLTRALVLSGLGIAFTGVSNHGSMGEHQISHYIDCFARDRHPGTLHGQQVGLATLTMGRIQQWFLGQERPPLINPTLIDSDDMARRMGEGISAQCEREYRKKALDENGAAALNERLQEIWSDLRSELSAWVVPVSEMSRRLAAAGGAITANDLGIPVDFYREAVRHAHEMRDRFSFADLACDAGLLDEFAAGEV